MNLPIPSRRAAGRTLAAFLEHHRGQRDLAVLALSPGGVPVASEIAQALDAPLDLYLVHKLTVPGNEEVDIGALVSGGVQVLNEDIIRSRQISKPLLNQSLQQQQQDLLQQERALRGDRPRLPVKDRWVILVDDYVTTGATMRGAIRALRQQEAARFILAVPVAPTRMLDQLQAMADEVAFIATQEPFMGAEWWYADNRLPTQEALRDLLQQARAQQARAQQASAQKAPAQKAKTQADSMGSAIA